MWGTERPSADQEILSSTGYSSRGGSWLSSARSRASDEPCPRGEVPAATGRLESHPPRMRGADLFGHQKPNRTTTRVQPLQRHRNRLDAQACSREKSVTTRSSAPTETSVVAGRRGPKPASLNEQRLSEGHQVDLMMREQERPPSTHRDNKEESIASLRHPSRVHKRERPGREPGALR